MVGDTVAMNWAPAEVAAREALRQSPYDLVLLDLDLPDNGGAELLPLLNKPPQLATPALIYSSPETPEWIVDQVYSMLEREGASEASVLAMIDHAIRPEDEPVKKSAAA